MFTAASLKEHTSKDLAQMAKKKGVDGWHSMRKEQLIRALLKIAKQKEKEKKAKALSRSKRPSKSNSVKPPTIKSSSRISKPKPATPTKKRASRSTIPVRSESEIANKLREDRERKESLKNLAKINSSENSKRAPESDRLILVVRDAFWLQAYWEITKATVQRAKVALNGSWHNAKPVLRLLEITSDGNTNSVENVVQEIEIHGGVKNWYINLKEPTKAYRISIGYVVPDGRFHLICKSNQVSPPTTGNSTFDENWTDITNEVEKYYALSGGYQSNAVSGDLQAVFEEKSRQLMNAPAFERLGSGINSNGYSFDFQVDAHMIVYGATNPNGSVTIGGEPVRLQNDGTFSLKIDLPDRRQVLPVVASSRDGTQQRTTVLAVERNTKVMEPVSNEIENM